MKHTANGAANDRRAATHLSSREHMSNLQRLVAAHARLHQPDRSMYTHSYPKYMQVLHKHAACMQPLRKLSSRAPTRKCSTHTHLHCMQHVAGRGVCPPGKQQLRL
jgi:hypothetical protein